MKFLSFIFCCLSINGYSYQSYPTADNVLYVDFDGEQVGENWVSADESLSSSKKDSIIRVVAEDFLPFLVNVTDERSVYDNTDNSLRAMVVVTDSTVSGVPLSVGGVAGVVGALPGYVFSHNLSYKSLIIGQNISHEAGHMYGLGHDGMPGSDYWFGHGDYCSIMGAGCPFAGSIFQWSNGDYQGATNTQDDIEILTNYFGGLRTDDHSDNISSASELSFQNSTITESGHITSRGDVDVFRFTTTGGQFNLTVQGSGMGTNLDPQIKILNTSSSVIQSSTTSQYDLSSNLSTYLNAGTYYVLIDGVGYGDPITNGYTDYGSLGAYSISGTINGITANTNQVPQINLQYPNTNTISMNPSNSIDLQFTVVDDSQVQSVEVKHNGVLVANTNQGNAYNSSITPGVIGSHLVEIFATDNQGFSSRYVYEFFVESSCSTVMYENVVATDASAGYSGNPMINLFDGDYDPYKTWASHTDPYFVEFQKLDANVEIGQIKIFNGSSINQAATEIKVYNSDDANNFDQAIYTLDIPKKAETSITIPTANKPYFRIEFETDNAYNFSLREIDLYEVDCPEEQTVKVNPLKLANKLEIAYNDNVLQFNSSSLNQAIYYRVLNVSGEVIVHKMTYSNIANSLNDLSNGRYLIYAKMGHYRTSQSILISK